MIKLIFTAVFLSASWARAQSVSTRSLGNLLLQDVPEIPSVVAEKMLQYQNTRGADLSGFSPDGDGMLVRTRFAETMQLHWVKTPGGARRQLTFFPEPVAAASLRPAPGARQILYTMDRGGTENYQLYLCSLKDGSSAMLTDGKSRHEGALWSRDGARLVYNGTARNAKDFDFYLYDAIAEKSTRLLEVEGQWNALDWSLDGKKLLVQNYVSINESYIHILDAASGKLEPLFAGQESRKVGYGTAKWTAGGVLFTSDETGEFVRLGELNLKTKAVRWLTADIPWNVEEVAVSHDGTKAAFTVNEDGLSRLYAGAAAGPFAAADAAPRGVLYSLDFSRDGKSLGLAANTPTSPGDVYAMDWAARKFTRWTESETGGLPGEAFLAPALIHYPTFDSVLGKPREIPAFYYRPKGEGPFPVVIVIHGGPEAQERPFFNPIFQYWLRELGIAVLAPNVRGSDGYGKSYLLLDNGRKREDSVKDIGALLDWVDGRPELDRGRVAVYGGSYGGYMVLAALTHYGKRLKAGVDIVGISNFATFLKNTQAYRRDLRRAEYGDERDPEMERFLNSISPTTNVSRIQSALFVVQGANDPRVPASEAEQIVRAVRGAGHKVWYMLGKDEGHGFQKKVNRDAMGQAVSLFWQEQLIR